MIELNAIVLLRRDASNPLEKPLEPGQHFRELGVADVDSLSKVYRAHGRTGDPNRLRRRFEEHGFRCFAIEEGDRLIAWFWALHGVPRYFDELGWRFPLEKKTAWLRDAFVIPERRRRHLLHTMMSIGGTVESAPAEYISDVSRYNRWSLRAHRSLGFTPFATVYGLMLGNRLLIRGSTPPPQLPVPTELDIDKRVLWLTPEQRKLHRAWIA